MKKFYFSIFAAALLMVGFSAQAQYNSIFANPSGFTFDDPRFWIGGAPPNPCNACFINVNSSTTMPPNAVQSTALAATTNVFNSAVNPGTSHNDGSPLTVGMKFQSTVAGQVLGASFWKTGLMTGTHIGALYNTSGTLLGSATFTAETASGWQTQNFVTPVTIQPGVTYIIAVFMANNFYTFTDNVVSPGINFTAAPIQNGNMIATQDIPADRNGLFVYNGALTFPNQAFTPGVNYWVDVNFLATPYNFADVVFNSSTINAIGTLDLNLNTVTHLNGTALTMSNNPTSVQNLFVNDQMFLDPGSTIRLGNGNTVANTNNDVLHAPLVGTFNFGGVGIFPGIYTVRSASPGPLGATDGTLTKLVNSNFDGTNPQGPVNPYTLNCTITCAPGLVFGPAITQYDAINNFYGFAASTVLPVVLVQLLATRNDDGSIKISWATSQEENAGYYDVERSSDQSGWTKVGTVKAKGYSSTTTNYSFTDRLPLDGTGYYRLKMTDIDGKFTYSRTVSVTDSKTKVPLVVYSNPFSDQIRLKVNVSRSQNLVMTVSDMMGKTYLSQSYHAQSGDNFVNLLPPVSASGMYILRIHGDSYDQTVKLEKQ